MAGRRPKARYTVPSLINGRGTIPIDRSFRGVGRIRTASGTTDDAVYVRMMDALDSLYDAGNLPTLEALRDGQVTAMEVYANTVKKGATSQMTVNLDRPLIDTINSWLVNHAIKDATRKSYADHLAVLYKFCNAKDQLRELVKRLDAFRKSSMKRKTGTTFNRTRAVLMAFAKSEYRDTSPFYQSIRQVPVIPNVRSGQSNMAVSVGDIVRLTDAIDPKAAPMVWSMCFGGFRLGEYLEKNQVTWETKKDRLIIHIHNPGHGNKGYTRTVMLPFPLTQSTIGDRQFRRYIDRAKGPLSLDVTTHTFRKCFAHWMELAGIPRTRRMAYLGHGKTDVTDIYEVHDVEKYLIEDADTFKAFVDKERKQAAVPIPAALLKYFSFGTSPAVPPTKTTAKKHR